ncbi:MAG: HAD family phosphatase [Desulfomonile tiedjei]|uniref:HAD family phosphatase n=1 Tax=Desulfomonile tiedjei TaxID=2358 RepID=A0A9D6Z4E5_9BACT|nr:HAD family phosphatase [Desulfomonile tiedjei]
MNVAWRRRTISGITVTDILFDLGNVLVPVDWERAFQRLEIHMSPDLVQMWKTDRPGFQALFHDPGVALETGRIDFARFHEIMMGVLRLDLDVREFRTAWCDIFMLDERMADLAESLSTEYGVWLASNTSRAHWRYIIARWPRLSFFKGVALSFELNCMKPSPEYYRKAIEMFGVDPASSVFIDDLQDNVDGAVRSGMTGIVFQGRDQLLSDLHELGVYKPVH